MITFENACAIAMDFYKQSLNIDGLAKALNGEEFWYFSGGKPGEMRVGNTIIAVSKTDGSVSVVDLPSKSSFESLRKASPIELPR